MQRLEATIESETPPWGRAEALSRPLFRTTAGERYAVECARPFRNKDHSR